MPTVSIFTTVFAPLAQSEAQALGLKDFRLVKIPHPLESLSRDEIASSVKSIADDVARGLIADPGDHRQNHSTQSKLVG